MNILFFLTPKSEVAYIFENETLRQTLEKMEHRKFSCIPLLSLDGKYTGTISEGDLLGLKNVKDEILSDKPVMLLNETTGEKFELKYDLSTRQKDIILAGGLLNYTRESL